MKKNGIPLTDVLVVLAAAGLCIAVLISLFWPKSEQVPVTQPTPVTAEMKETLRDAASDGELSYADGMAALEQAYDLSNLDECYVWAFGEGKYNVYTLTEWDVDIDEDATWVDYDTMEYALAFEREELLYYVINRSSALEADLAAIFAGDSARTSEGVYRLYADWFSAHTAQYHAAAGEVSIVIDGEEGEKTAARRCRYVRIAAGSEVDETFSDAFPSARIVYLSALSKVAEAAFAGLDELERFSVAENDVCYLEDGALVYAPTQTLLRYPPARTDKSVVIGTQVRFILPGAFRGLLAEELTLPFVGQARNTAFGLSGLFGIIFGESETGVSQLYAGGTAGFAIPQTLRRVTITDEVRLAYGAFSFCGMLEELSLNEGLEQIAAYAFTHCVALTELKLPKTVTQWEMSAFESYPDGFCWYVPDGLALPAALQSRAHRIGSEDGYTLYRWDWEE